MKNTVFASWRMLLLLFWLGVGHSTWAYAVINAEKIATGTVLLSEKQPLDFGKLTSLLKADWDMDATSAEISDRTMIFSISGATVMIAYLDYPASVEETAAAVQISWLWQDAAAEVSRHQSQAVVTIIHDKDNMENAYTVLTKVTGAILDCSNSIGVFMPGQFLLIPRSFYQAAARNMQRNGTVPILCWIYFGIQQDGNNSGAFTYGLREFGTQEMEVVQSNLPMNEVQLVIQGAAAFAIQSKMPITSGQTITLPQVERVVVQSSNGHYLEGTTLKLTF